jgi:hypothetical protein
MFKKFFGKNYSKIILVATKSEKDFYRPDELLNADYKLVHLAMVNRLITCKSQTTVLLTIRLWRWLLSNGCPELRDQLVKEQVYIVSAIKNMNDREVEKAFIRMLIDAATFFKDEPGLTQMLEFAAPTLQAKDKSITNSRPISNNVNIAVANSLMGLKQVQKHANITLSACDMLVEAMNFNEGNNNINT